MIRENRVRRGLKEGQAFIGTFTRLTDPAAVEIIGLAGFDFVIVDNEHTAMGRDSMVGLIRAADASGLIPTVRVREKNAAEILQALDSGALGVQVPQVDTKADAMFVVESAKYAPTGKRGFAASQRAAGYGFMDPNEYAREANENTLVVCYCETLQGLRNLDDILTVNEVDVIFIGPYDLSQALGVIGQPSHPKVLEAIDEITHKTRAAGKATGIIAADAAQARYWLERGLQYISLSSDTAMIGAMGRQFMRELREWR